ncbi:MAG: hypothetical protein LR015_01805 [Verrucomicrobia bacterium]|nr:hypothetical protein [Verrucomicrobiota bacterium]
MHLGLNGSLRTSRVFEGTSTSWAWLPTARIQSLGHLEAGLHTIHLQRREAGMKLDRLMIADDPSRLLPGSFQVGPAESRSLSEPESRFEITWLEPGYGEVFAQGQAVLLHAQVDNPDNEEFSIVYRLNGEAMNSGLAAGSFEVDDLAPGEYWLIAELVRNGQIVLTSDVLQFSVVATGADDAFDQWIGQFADVLTSAQMTPLASPAGDGISNLHKFFFGLHPLEPADQSSIWQMHASAHETLTFSFRQAAQAAGVGFLLEHSVDLHSWQTLPSAPWEGTVEENHTYWQLELPIAPERNFYRLRLFVNNP